MEPQKFISLVGRVVQGRCLEKGITDPTDIANQFELVSDVAAEVIDVLSRAIRGDEIETQQQDPKEVI